MKYKLRRSNVPNIDTTTTTTRLSYDMRLLKIIQSKDYQPAALDVLGIFLVRIHSLVLRFQHPLLSHHFWYPEVQNSSMLKERERQRRQKSTLDYKFVDRLALSINATSYGMNKENNAELIDVDRINLQLHSLLRSYQRS